MTAITTLPVVFPRTWPIIIHGLGSLNASAPLRLEQAKMQAQQANAKLEAYWASLRVVHATTPGSATCLMSPATPASGVETKRNDHQPDLRQALQLYLDLKGKNRPKSFEAAATRTCNYLIGIASNKPLVIIPVRML